MTDRLSGRNKSEPTEIGNILASSIVDLITRPENKSETLKWLRSLGPRIEQFGKIPSTYLCCDAFWNLTEQETKVLLVLLTFRNDKKGLSSPGYTKMLEVLRRWKPQFAPASLKWTLRKLNAKGFIYTYRKACKGHCTDYFIAMNNDQVEALKDLNSNENTSNAD